MDKKELYLQSLKKFCIEYARIDYDLWSYDPPDLYLYSAIEYVKNATGITIDDVIEQDNVLYKLAVAMLFCHWYENRAITTSENNSSLKQSLTYIFLQLKHCYEKGE